MIRILLMLGVLINTTFAADLVWKARAIFTIKENRVVDFKEAISSIIGPTLNEKGCISYKGFQVFDEEAKLTNKFEFNELWISKDALMVDHMNSTHMKVFFETIKMGKSDSWIEYAEFESYWVETLK